MPRYLIHRMKDQPRENFRWAPHVSSGITVKLKDYDPAGEVEAQNEYEAWVKMRSSDRPLALGDLLESEAGELRVCKYVGFEPAKWFTPESQAQAAGAERPVESEVR